MQERFWICFTVALSLCANQAFGQSGDPAQTPGSYNAGMGGYHTSTGIAIGAAAAGAGIAYLVLHNHAHGTVVGCLQPSDGASMTLLSDDKKSTYALINNDAVTLKAGERVALRGRRIRQSSGELAFEVHGLAKEYGECER